MHCSHSIICLKWLSLDGRQTAFRATRHPAIANAVKTGANRYNRSRREMRLKYAGRVSNTACNTHACSSHAIFRHQPIEWRRQAQRLVIHIVKPSGHHDPLLPILPLCGGGGLPTDRYSTHRDWMQARACGGSRRRPLPPSTEGGVKPSACLRRQPARHMGCSTLRRTRAAFSKHRWAEWGPLFASVCSSRIKAADGFSCDLRHGCVPVGQPNKRW